ncbi:thioredoxin [Enterococcus faecium]|nr:thioredoxin [Enterococcus faecium]EMF0115479.1 thioredoxin [Enterococcus hirae]
MIKEEKRWLIVLIHVGILCLIGILGCVWLPIFKEKQEEVVKINPTEEQILFFYKEDCKDCQRIFPVIYWHSFFKKDVVYVNLSVKENQLYIQKYHLQEVPTLCRGQTVVSGTDVQAIRKFLYP